MSSTLRELADERRAARDAIERLHLAPVMFELGARPHPPRSLYRSYLAQSRRLRRHLRRELRLGGTRRGGLGPRGRVQPRAGLDAEAHLHQGRRRPRRPPARADRPHPLRRHRRLPSVPRRRRTRRARRERPRHAARRTLRSVARPDDATRRSRHPRSPCPGPVHADHRPRGRPAAGPRSARDAATTAW